MKEEYWYSKGQGRIAVGAMNVQHLRNTLRMLIRKKLIITHKQSAIDFDDDDDKQTVPETPAEFIKRTRYDKPKFEANPYITDSMLALLNNNDPEPPVHRAKGVNKPSKRYTSGDTTFAEEMGHDEPCWFDDDLI